MHLYLELLTPCYGVPGQPGTALPGVHADRENLDPTKEFTYTFMRQLFTEIVRNVSKDSFVHLGMDEVIISTTNETLFYLKTWKTS